jgi:hypothetical protein
MLGGAPGRAVELIRRALREGYVDRDALSRSPLKRSSVRRDFKALREVKARPGMPPELITPLGRVTRAGTLELRNRFERRRDRGVLERL